MKRYTHIHSSLPTIPLQWYLLIGVLIIYAIYFSWLAILRFDTFTSSYDLANMDQTVWNGLHGRLFEFTGTTGTISRLSVHADFFLILLAPLYLLWDNVRMLLIFQSIMLALGGIPVFLLAKKMTQSSVLAYILMLIYLASPGLEWKSIYDFHSVVMAIPLMLSTFYFAYTKQWRWFMLFAALTIITKEEIPLDLAMIGVWMAVVWKEWKKGVLTIVVCFAWSLSMFFWIIPAMNASHVYQYTSWYNQFLQQVKTTAPLQLPSVITTNYISNSDGANYLLLLLKEYAFLPLLGLPLMIFALPELLINLFSSHAQMRSILFQYDSGIIPGLMIATIGGIAYMQKLFIWLKLTKKKAAIATIICGLIALLMVIKVNIDSGPLPINPHCSCWIYQVTPNDQTFANVLQTIPANASITASPEIRSHLTHRENAFTIPAATNSADFIALIDQDRILGNTKPKTYEIVLIKQLQTSPTYTLINHTGDFYLYKKSSQ